MLRIPLAKPSFDEREVSAVRTVLESRMVVQGPYVASLEQKAKALQHMRECKAVSNGTAALHLLYLACGLGPGDAVFVPSFAFPAAANMAYRVGARPVYVDVQPGTYNISLEDLKKRIIHCRTQGWGNPKAIVVVHEFGLTADTDAFMDIARTEDIPWVFEDAACALGAKDSLGRHACTIGHAGVVSFHPRKSITTGEGGAVLTNDSHMAERIDCLRNHGQVVGRSAQRDFLDIGFNYRMTDIQAAIGLVQMEKFDGILADRQRAVQAYVSAMAEVKGIEMPTLLPHHTWQTFMVVLPKHIDRDQVVLSLASKGIGSGPGSVAGHYTSIYKNLYGYRPEDLPVSLRLHTHGLALPLYEGITHAEITEVVRCLEEALT